MEYRFVTKEEADKIPNFYVSWNDMGYMNHLFGQRLDNYKINGWERNEDNDLYYRLEDPNKPGYTWSIYPHMIVPITEQDQEVTIEFTL